jgi:hypothetical protein
MVVVLSLDGFPDGLMVGFAGDFPGGRVCTSGSAATPSIGIMAIDQPLLAKPLGLLRPVSHSITPFILHCNINGATHKTRLAPET